MKGKFIFGSPFIEIETNGNKLPVLLDTGFNGELMLPSEIIKKLKLEELGLADYLSADGKRNIVKIYAGKIKIFDEEREVEIISGPLNFAVSGMELFHFYKIIIERHKDIIEIEKTA